jgi:predicted DNA-binding protein
MTTLTIKLSETDYQRLQNAAKRAGKSVQALISEWILQLTEADSDFDVTQDPIYQMEGYDSDAPEDLSKNLDKIHLWRKV